MKDTFRDSAPAAFLICGHDPSPRTQSKNNGDITKGKPPSCPMPGWRHSLGKTRWSSYSLNTVTAQEMTSHAQNRYHFLIWWNATPGPTGRQGMGEETSTTTCKESQHEILTETVWVHTTHFSQCRPVANCWQRHSPVAGLQMEKGKVPKASQLQAAGREMCG